VEPVFRRRSAETDAVQLSVDPELPAAQQAKGRPTPTRKDAEAARKAQLTSTADPKASKKESRDADRQARYQSRLALQAGDERHLPARDAGPVKAWVRDLVDGRLSAGELFIPVAVAVLLLGFVKVAWLQVGLLWVWSFMLVGVVLDSLYLLVRLSRELPQRFPDADHRGTKSYAILRSLQIRRLRLPPPKFKANGKPAPPKKPKKS